jgi:hypothetical protein
VVRLLRLVLPVLVLTPLLAAPATAAVVPPRLPEPPATPPPKSRAGVLQVGISEQLPGIFRDRGFLRLGMRHARVVVPWNVALRRGWQRERLGAWLFGAAAANIEPHVAFNATRMSRYARPPSRRAYRRAFRAFRRAFPSVKVFTPWNEANHVFQPTARRPEAAAAFFDAVKDVCISCTVVGADLLDQRGLDAWLGRFLRAVRHRPRVWGLHNYQDGNHRRPAWATWTVRLPRLVKGQIWATETGGIVRFRTDRGRIAYRYSPRRAADSVRHVFALMRRPETRRRYTRVYVYNWYGASTRTRAINRWDSGLVGITGRPRPALQIVRRQLRVSARQAAAAVRRSR